MHQQVLLVTMVMAVSTAFLNTDRWSDLFTKSEEDRILQRYPELFKTEDEIKCLQSLKYASSAAQKRRVCASPESPSGSTTASIDTCSVPFTTIYHACCETNETFTRFSKMLDLNDKMVKLVQLSKNKQYQFIEMDTCRASSDYYQCNCTCQKQYRFYTVLIYNPDYDIDRDPVTKKYKFHTVKAMAICRCLNDAPSGSAGSKRDKC
ncbi:hypothetical protein ElyMa_000948300 [Elysia marginata]|uniref:Spaetzle domain-containing protein n=1 Tax=Elysia marginata TaxID=1093978 RepID=A0AAV4HCN4_9GAST|nr:hypothetical protein ElyMa_000948300 [Elysia marginata]